MSIDPSIIAMTTDMTTRVTRPTRRSLLLGAGGAGVAALLARGVPAAAAPGPAVPSTEAGTAATPTVTLATSTAGSSGHFSRVRVTDDEHRLNLTYPGQNGGPITGQVLTAPGHYGLDIATYPTGPTAPATLQQVFANTPFSFLGFYFATTGHPDRSWVGRAPALLAQGWALLPIYFGRQQYWSASSDNQISSSPTTATAQGTADGIHAVDLATTEKLPRGARLFLNITPTQNSQGANAAPTTATINYIKAWLTAVGNGNYVGALVDSNAHWTTGSTTFYDAVVIHGLLGSASPVTWVAYGVTTAPPGVSATHWPLDGNGDVFPVAVKQYSTGAQWQFASFASAWQFEAGWAPGTAAFLTDTGASQRFTTVAAALDLDVATSGDPGNTQAGQAKSARRRSVSAVAVSPTTVAPKNAVTVTVTLDHAAAAPNGETVLLRSSSANLLLPTAVVVAAGQTTATVSAHAANGSPATTVTVTARNLHQLTGTPPSTTLHIAS